jgi:hypothetical protein
MAIFKDGGSGDDYKSLQDAKEKAYNDKEKYFSKEMNMFVDSNFTKNSPKTETKVKEKSYTDLYIEGNFAGIFSKARTDAASMKHNQSNEDNLTMVPFYDFLHETMMREIVQFNKTGLFLEELNHFLDSKEFSDGEKNTFLNSHHNTLIEESLKINRFDIAKKINNYRANKDIKYLYKLLQKKAGEENYEAVEQILSLSTNVTAGNSEVLRTLFSNGCRDLDFYKKIISTYEFDINAVGGTPGLEGKHSFSHLVAYSGGSKTKPF